MHVALRYPESFFLPDRTRWVAGLLGWSAVGCAFVAVALQRRLVQSRWWSRLAVALLVACGATVLWLVQVDARDYPRVNFAFVEGSGVERLLVLSVLGFAVPALLSLVVLLLLRRLRLESARQHP